jgi:predicted nucleic acid-binding protein
MERPVGRRLILDTNVLIAVERATLSAGLLADDDELAVAAVTVAEYRVGIELADTPERAAERARKLELLMADIDVLDYTPRTAVHHARLLAYARRSGARRGPYDLIIAAHAAETGRTVVSGDAKAKFGDLPGVTYAAV